MFTTMLGLCLPAPPGANRAYRPLYNAADVDSSTKVSRRGALCILVAGCPKGCSGNSLLGASAGFGRQWVYCAGARPSRAQLRSALTCLALIRRTWLSGLPVVQEGRLELLRRSVEQLTTWRDLLQKFLRSDDDQVGASGGSLRFKGGGCGRPPVVGHFLIRCSMLAQALLGGRL